MANEEKLKGVQLTKRDTTMLYKYGEKTTPGADMGWRAWRLRVTEPGVWMIHCHILQHMIMGKQLGLLACRLPRQLDFCVSKPPIY